MTKPNPAEETHVAVAQVAATDALTGLASRHVFFLRGERAVARAKRRGRPLTLMVVDLDGTMHVNRDHGHLSVDAILKALAERLRGATREKDLVARVAGQVFAVLCTDTSKEDGLQLAECIRASVEKSPFSIPEREPIPMTASVGLAVISDQDAGIEDLMRRADSKMMDAKKAGRNRVCS